MRERLFVMLIGMERQPEIAKGQEVKRFWPRHRRCVGLARAELRKALADWGLALLEDTALVVLSELMTNAVVHAKVSPGRQIATSFRREADGVRIAVDDASEVRPVLRPQDPESGRGLHLVSLLSAQWGVDDRAGVGKTVWAVVTVPVEGWI
ncbi:ATP-binding protein [Streptomyces sp. NPDC049585]|uniref:ATP-binding protein n=1 Tax=Streptomyces sp. NPDC049585 TaxID=3155154 RepID=UPI003438A31E